MCEEYIVLRFLGTLKRKDRDNTVQAVLALKFQESLERQAKFFGSRRQFQPVVQPNIHGASRKESNDSLKEIATRTGLWNPRVAFPKIHWMAESLGIRSFYDFYYGLSSEVVHFNPRVLLRMGWGPDGGVVNFGARHFSKYYRVFGFVYGCLLFTEIIRASRRRLNILSELMKLVKNLEYEINDLLRWPEPVTFEELNLEPPNVLLRAVLKMAHT